MKDIADRLIAGGWRCDLLGSAMKSEQAMRLKSCSYAVRTGRSGLRYRAAAFAITVVATPLVGCSAGSPVAATTNTVTVTVSATPQVNAAVFAELDRLNDKFIARVSAVPDIRTEVMDRRDIGTTELAHLGQDLCMTMLSKPYDGGPDAALSAAGAYFEASMWISNEPMSKFVKTTVAQAAADTFCPDNPAGVR